MLARDQRHGGPGGVVRSAGEALAPTAGEPLEGRPGHAFADLPVREDEAAAAAEHAQATAMLEAERLEFAQDRIDAATGAIARELTALAVLPEAERAPRRVRVHELERGLARALSERAALLQRRVPQLQALAAEGEDVAAELARARRDLAGHRADLDTLAGVFSPAKGAAVEETYRTKVAGLHCMGAAYAGLAALTSPERSAAVERQVQRKAKASEKRQGPNVDQFITVMVTARAAGLAGPKQRAAYDRRRERWSPTLESVLRARVNPRVPGFYFFGLALAEAFHSVLIGVSTWDAPRTMWCDQYGCTPVEGTLDEYALGRLKDWQRRGVIHYRDWDSYLWQVLPPAEAGVTTAPEVKP